jgi:hypothetical protein
MFNQSLPVFDKSLFGQRIYSSLFALAWRLVLVLVLVFNNNRLSLALHLFPSVIEIKYMYIA